MQYVKHGGQWDCETESLEHGPDACRVEHLVIKSDSASLVNGIPNHVVKWQGNGWVTAGRQPVKYRELWETLLNTIKEVKRAGASVSFWHVRREENEEADELANAGLTLRLSDM